MKREKIHLKKNVRLCATNLVFDKFSSVESSGDETQTINITRLRAIASCIIYM